MVYKELVIKGEKETLKQSLDETLRSQVIFCTDNHIEEKDSIIERGRDFFKFGAYFHIVIPNSSYSAVADLVTEAGLVLVNLDDPRVVNGGFFPYDFSVFNKKNGEEIKEYLKERNPSIKLRSTFLHQVDDPTIPTISYSHANIHPYVFAAKGFASGDNLEELIGFYNSLHSKFPMISLQQIQITYE